MDKQQVADWYMETFADKTKSFGCNVIIFGTKEEEKITEMYGSHIEVSSHGDYSFFIDEYKVIGHPVTWGRLLQMGVLEKIDHITKSNQTEIDLESLLWEYQVLDKTIYERVENKEVLDILIEIKDLYNR